MSYLYNKKLKKCTIKITAKNRERCRKLWISAPQRFSQMYLTYPIDNLEVYKKYGREKEFYIDAVAYLEKEAGDITKTIEEIRQASIKPSLEYLLTDEEENLVDALDFIKYRLNKIKKKNIND